MYHVLIQKAARDRQWAEYFLLINACYEIIKTLPTNQEEYDRADIEALIGRALEQIGKAIEAVLPGGTDELQEYIPQRQL